MVHKTILRLAVGMELPGQLKANLREILGEFEIENYPAVPDLKRSYQRRIDSLEQAFTFILDTIPVLTEKKEALLSYAAWCRQFCSLPVGEVIPIQAYQDTLTRYTALLLNALVDNYPYEDKEGGKIHAAIELLNKAEQYVIMKKGRPDLATLIPIKLNDSIEFVLRWEEQLPPYSETTLQEFRTIKESSLSTPPGWFRKLPSVWQLYLHSCIPAYLLAAESNADVLNKIKMNLNDFDLQWSKIKHDHGLELEGDLISISKNEFPQWFTGLKKEHQQLLKIFCESGYSVPKIDGSFSEFNSRVREWKERSKESNPDIFNAEKLKKLRPLPYWFLVLEDYEQRFLRGVLRSAARVEDCISFVPSRLRRLPLVANLCQTNVFLLNDEGKKVKTYPPRLRSSHLASRDVRKLPIQVRELHAKRNLARIASFADADQALLIQTLISPVKFLEKQIPDYYLDQQRLQTIASFQKEYGQFIRSTNHPLNMDRYLHYTPANAPYCLAILDVADIILMTKSLPGIPLSWDANKIKHIVAEAFQDVLVKNKISSALSLPEHLDSEEQSIKDALSDLFRQNYELLLRTSDWQLLFASQLNLRKKAVEQEKSAEYAENLLDLQALAKEYQAVLNSSYGTATIFDYYGRELFLSSLENLLIGHANGKSYGSCVSGKDRREVVETHTIAMQLYRQLKGRWPSMSDSGTDRAEFVELVATLDVSRHGHEHAGQNADGSDGIKTPANYWPKDIAAAICKKQGKDALLNSDILATNNEVGRIGALDTLITPNYSNCLFSALSLSKRNRETVLSILAILCGEATFLRSKTWSISLFPINPMSRATKIPKAPIGFEAIKEILDCPGTDENALIHKLAQIYFDIGQRPKDNWLRATEIQRVYTALLNLCKDPKSAEEQIRVLDEIKGEIFRSNTQQFIY
ncbi:oxidoreductase [Legionella lansingensis]|uniref:Oxidoreductase n=1 Tax=Legionella lansingensis TaxID=45067 RepID=A0A0W0VLD5_9GAMM|nr:Dot/Icm T4SS effector PI-3-phosphatase SidP [Legionella lansingensis]KTD20946.1 oxidoreductase [Legionella lansingensis]SNV44462.1 oxidoreductase [Legionella lansingensis]